MSNAYDEWQAQTMLAESRIIVWKFTAISTSRKRQMAQQALFKVLFLLLMRHHNYRIEYVCNENSLWAVGQMILIVQNCAIEMLVLFPKNKSVCCCWLV